MTAHREALKEALAQIHLKDVSVVDWGSGSKPAQKYIQHERCDFYRIDKNPVTGPDLVADICEPLEVAQFDVAFCLEVLEHVKRPGWLLQNIYDNLEEGGTLYLSVPFQFEIHAEEDYWRYTENGIRLLLGNFGFTVDEVKPVNGVSGYFVRAHK